MTTRYPGAIDGYSQIRQARNRVDEIVAEDHNDLRSAILAIENALGINPQGSSSVADRLDDQASNFDDHVDGVGFRHVDTHIDAGAKSATYNNLGAGTTTTQIQELLDLFDYAGSGASKFADGVGLSVQNFKSTPADIVSKLGSTSGDDKVGAAAQVGSPTSLPSGSVRDHTNALLTALNSNINEVQGARQSDRFGIFALLDDRLEAIDGYISAVVTCTDGTNSLGGMYNGQDALQNAIQNNFNGATILLRRGEYHIDVPLTIGKMMHIVGVEDEVVIVNEVPNVMLTYEPDAYGSSIRNVSIINFGAGIYDAVFNMTDEFLIKQCKVEGSITFSACSRSRIEQSYIYPVGRNCITILGPNTISTKISQCRIMATGDGYKMLDYRGSICDVSDCIFLDSYGSQAIVDTPTSEGLKIRGCAIRCEPYRRDRQVVHLTGLRPEIDDLYMLTYGPGNISTSLLSVAEATTFRGRNIRINLGENLIGDISPGAFGPNNPVAIVAADAILDGFIMDGGMVPRAGDGWVLDGDYPLIQLTGIPHFDVVGSPTQLTKGRVKLCNATISAPYHSTSGGAMNVTLIGDQGQGGGMAQNPNGFFELENVNIDGYRCAAWTAAADSKHMVSNIQYNSKIHGCSFTDGETSGWNNIINVVDAYDVQIMDNSFLLTGIATCEQVIMISSAGASAKATINGNNINFTDLDTTGWPGVIVLDANDCVANNNIIWNLSPAGPGIPLILMGGTNNVAIGNRLHTGDGGAANIPIFDLGGGVFNLWNHYVALGINGFVPPPPPPLSLGPITYDLNIVS